MNLERAVCRDGKTEKVVCRRAQAGANGDGGPADLKKTNGQGHEHLCDTGMPVWNGNFGTDRNNKGCKCAKTTAYEK